jgi:hypothetical protein
MKTTKLWIPLKQTAGEYLDSNSSHVCCLFVRIVVSQLIRHLDVLVGGFLWYWIPGFLWTGLSSFAWVTWLKPDNVIVNQLFGGTSGYSLGAPFTIFTLDWTTINGYLGSPLVSPWHAIGNTSMGFNYNVLQASR